MSIARRTFEWLALAAILGAAAYLRLANGALTPGWYSDEGTHLNVAHNLLLGRTQYLAVGQSTLLFARLPLFEWLLAGALQLAGAGPGGSPERGLMVLRALTGALGVLTVLALYGLLRRTGRGLALGAALVYALYPSAVVYSRLGFSYNLLAPLLLAAVWGLWRWLEAPGRAWGLAVAALAVGFGALSDLWMLAAVPAVVLVVVVRLPRALTWASALMGLPLAGYLVAAWLAAPAALITDLRFTLFRIGSRSLLDQLALLADNYASLLAQEGWLALGLVGLFRLCPVRLGRLLLLFFFVPLVLVGRSSSLVSLSFYYLIPLLPLAAAGLAALLVEATPASLRLPPRAAGWLGWAGRWRWWAARWPWPSAWTWRRCAMVS